MSKARLDVRELERYYGDDGLEALYKMVLRRRDRDRWGPTWTASDGEALSGPECPPWLELARRRGHYNLIRH